MHLILAAVTRDREAELAMEQVREREKRAKRERKESEKRGTEGQTDRETE